MANIIDFKKLYTMKNVLILQLLILYKENLIFNFMIPNYDSKFDNLCKNILNDGNLLSFVNPVYKNLSLIIFV